MDLSTGREDTQDQRRQEEPADCSCSRLGSPLLGQAFGNQLYYTIVDVPSLMTRQSKYWWSNCFCTVNCKLKERKRFRDITSIGAGTSRMSVEGFSVLWPSVMRVIRLGTLMWRIVGASLYLLCAICGGIFHRAASGFIKLRIERGQISTLQIVVLYYQNFKCKI